MASQGYKVRTVKPKSIIHPAPFVRGFNEVKHGVPMDYNAYNNAIDGEAYERGRMFANVFNGALKCGKRVTWEAEIALSNAFYTGALI